MSNIIVSTVARLLLFVIYHIIMFATLFTGLTGPESESNHSLEIQAVNHYTNQDAQYRFLQSQNIENKYSVLEIGSGNGRWLKPLGDMNEQVIGI